MRNTGLDLLRLLAVVLVLGSHLPPPPPSVWIGFRLWHTGGWIGVDLFFVLSGFLISGLLFREYRINGDVWVGRFLIRRAFKLYPAFWVMTAFTVGYLMSMGQPLPGAELAAELLFVQNYFAGLWNHTWSLAVEEHFYLLLAALIVWMAHARARSGEPFSPIPTIFIALALVCLGLRAGNLWWSPTFDYAAWMFHTHIRIDSLMFGVLLGWLYHFRGLAERMRRVPGWLLILGGLALFSPFFVFAREQYAWVSIVGLVACYLASGMWVIAATRLERVTLPPVRMLAALGATSYSIYLWHMPVNVWGTRWFIEYTGIRGTQGYLLSYLLGSILVGFVLSHLIEWPVLRLRDRWFPSRSRASSVASGVPAAGTAS